MKRRGLPLQHVLFRVVGGANERSAFHVAEAHLLADSVQLSEGVGVDKLRHRKVLGGGLEVLAQGDTWQPTERRSSMVSTTSSKVSPNPSITPNLVRNHVAESGLPSCGRTWPGCNTFGRATHRLKVVRHDLRSPERFLEVLHFPAKSGMRFQGGAGLWWRMARTVWAFPPRRLQSVRSTGDDRVLCPSA